MLEVFGCGTISLQNEKHILPVFFKQLQIDSWNVKEDERQWESRKIFTLESKLIFNDCFNIFNDNNNIFIYINMWMHAHL